MGEINISNTNGNQPLIGNVIGSTNSQASVSVGGDLFAGTRDVITASSATPDIAQLLSELADAAAAMVREGAPEQQVVENVEAITREAVREPPRREWWDLSVKGLAAAAKDVGDIGKPVLEILAKLAPLIEKMIV